MTSTPVKNIGAVTGGTGIGRSGMKLTGKAGFEAVWNRQTDRNGAEQTASESGRTSTSRDDVAVRNSLKAKDSHKNTVKRVDESETSDAMKKTEANDLRDMDPGEWEEAMEVLGTAAATLVQQIAENFGMQPEEVQNMMAQLGMSELDLLQADKLSQLLLMAGGAEDMTALLTDGELYQQYQELIAQAQTLLDECSNTLQMDARQLLEAKQSADMPSEQSELSEEQELPIEVTVEETSDKDPLEELISDHAEKNVGDSGSEKIQDATGQSGKADADKHANHGQQEERNIGHGQQANLLLQNLRTEQFTSQIGQMQEADSVWDADTQNIMRQIMDFMKIQIKPDMSDLEMQLHPESLGTLQIHVASKGGTITAQFVAQNESVKAALESQMVQLKENFAEQGMKVDAIEVTVQTHQFEQNLEQGRSRQQGESGKRNRTRRIQLEGPLDMADLETMDEDEQLAAQMMEANGNTVDYTA